MNRVILYFITNTKERITKFLNGIENKENSKINDTMEKETVIFSNTSNISMNKIENKLTIKNSVTDNKTDDGSLFITPDRRTINLLNKTNIQNIDRDSISDFNINSKEKNEDLIDRQSVKIEKTNNNFDDIKTFSSNDNNFDNKKNDTMSNKSDFRNTNPIRSYTNFNLNNNNKDVKPLLSTKPFLLQGNDNKMNNPSDIFHTKKRNKKIVLNKK